MTAKKIVRSLVVLTAPLLIGSQPGWAAETYQTDSVHSSVVFRVKHMNTSFAYGRFNEITGTFALDKASPSQSKFDFQVKAATIDTANAKRDQHLKGPDFFNVVQYPTLSFASKSVTASGDGFEVTGDLTMHGVTKPVTVQVVPTGAGPGPTGGKIAGIETTFTIKRSDFGMNKRIPMLADDVRVTVSVEGGVKK
jgi:polyisoprenoid-binding protein YceI